MGSRFKDAENRDTESIDSGALGARIQGCWDHGFMATCGSLGPTDTGRV